MNEDVRTVHPQMTVPDLERAFVTHKVGGFPVVEGDRLLGVVSRSDIVRMLDVERVLEDQISDYHRAWGPVDDSALQGGIGARIGARMEGRIVADVMIQRVLTCSPDQDVAEVAALLAREEIHRLPVSDAGRLVGIVTSMDLVRLIAERGLAE
jgi:CBS domain-containing protein